MYEIKVNLVTIAKTKDNNLAIKLFKQIKGLYPLESLTIKKA